MQDEFDREMEYLERIKKIEEVFNGKKVAMIALSESFNEKRENYLDYIIRSICFSGIDLRVWNPHFKKTLKEEAIYKMIDENLTAQEAKKKELGRISWFPQKERIQSEIRIKDIIKFSDEVNIFHSSDFINSRREENFDYILTLNPNAKVFQLDNSLSIKESRKLQKLCLKNGVCYVNLAKLAFYEEKNREIAHSWINAMYKEHVLEKVKRI